MPLEVAAVVAVEVSLVVAAVVAAGPGPLSSSVVPSAVHLTAVVALPWETLQAVQHSDLAYACCLQWP